MSTSKARIVFMILAHFLPMYVRTMLEKIRSRPDTSEPMKTARVVNTVHMMVYLVSEILRR